VQQQNVSNRHVVLSNTPISWAMIKTSAIDSRGLASGFKHPFHIDTAGAGLFNSQWINQIIISARAKQ
jgi:hypothetical protein